MRTDELDFALPPELIAQSPCPQRSASRLLHYRRDTGKSSHLHFAELVHLLREGDLLVFNDARVLPARFSLCKATGGHCEGLFLEALGPGQWLVMLRNVGTPAPGMRLQFLDDPSLTMEVLSKDDQGHYRVRVNSPDIPLTILNRLGRMPLPPYIHRNKDHDQRDADDRDRYQTVFASHGHAVAAPTAGLHFTPDLLDALDGRGIQKAFITLNVGLGTFKPVSSPTLEGHAMHSESYSISDDAARLLNAAKRDGRRIIPVGTTSTRVLESHPADQPFAPQSAFTNIFIYPPYQWKHISAMITNFHLPRSTLIALVAAFVGIDQQRELYQLAIQERYRFFSYGDAMFLE